MIETRSIRPSHVRRAAATTLVALFALQAPAFAQKSEAEVLAEIEFARGLAADWSFVDLAEEVISKVRRGGVSRSMEERLGLVECEVYTAGARAAKDTARRNELFEQALGAYQNFISSNPTSSQRSTAESAFVNTSAIYAQYLTMALEEATGEAANKLRERQAEVLEDAVSLTQNLIQGLQSIRPDERTEAEKRELYTLMLNAGQMMAEIGKAAGDSGISFFNNSIEIFENLIFEAGDGTPYALRAYVGIGRVYAYQGQWEDAAAYFEGVIDRTIPPDEAEWAEIVKNTNEQERGLRFLFLEIAAGPLMEAHMNAGNVEAACTYGMRMYNLQRQEGFAYSASGYDSLLAVARAVLDSGGFLGGDLTAGEAQWVATREELSDFPRRFQTTGTDFALRVAQQVTEENKGNILQVRAQKLVAEVIERPGVEVSPDILVQAAEGEYNDGQFLAAIEGYRRVLASLATADRAQRLQYGAQVMDAIGNCYRRLERPLEAAMAYREAVVTWDDAQYNEDCANRYYSMIRPLASAAGTDSDPLKALVSEAEQLVTAHGGKNVDRIAYQTAEKQRTSLKEYEQAITTYQTIEPTSDYYERAMVAIGRCKYRLGQRAEAFKIFDDYIERYVTDKRNETQSPSKLAQRQTSLAVAEFFRGLISWDNEDYAKVVQYVSGYAEKFEGQPSLAPWTMDMVVQSHLILKDRDSARATYEKMLELFPDSPRTGGVSIIFYKELKSLREAETDPAQIAALEREMAELLKRGNAVAATPSFSNMREESKHWMNIGAWAEAERVLLSLLQKFQNDPEQQKTLETYVRPDLAQAMLRLKKTGEAKAMLDGQFTDESARASKSVTLLWCQAMGGWLEEEGTKIVEVPGVGGTEEEFAQASKLLLSMRASADKYSCEWYELCFRYAFLTYAWGKDDSRKTEAAKDSLADLLKTLRASDFSAVNDRCSSDETDPEVRAVLGNGVLSARLDWLRSRVN